MSILVVRKTKIEEVQPHDNAERLDMIRVQDLGWWLVTGKGNYKVGDPCVYIQVDAVLDEKFINYFFKDSKIKPDSPTSHRVRSIKIRGNLSQGIVLKLDEEVLSLWPDLAKAEDGDDVSEILNIVKFEPSEAEGEPGIERKSHPDFDKFSDIENIKNYIREFKDGEDVYISLKLHGRSYRAGLLLSPDGYEFVVGSRNIQLDNDTSSSNPHLRITEALDIKNRLKPGEVIYGELVGPSMQKNYSYGFDDLKLFLYDVKINGKYLAPQEFKEWCDSRGFERVPDLYNGPFSQEIVNSLAAAKDHELDKNVPAREGVVVKPVDGRYSSRCGRLALKCINPDYYLLKDTSDFH